MDLRVTFWGTRGSIPTPEPNCMYFGGDTPCVEIRSRNTLIILDAGTGIRRLGAALMDDADFNGKGYIFLSHSHWDHIQGFPFFKPAFVQGNEFFIHGAFKADKRLQDALRGQMGSIYFPITMSDMPGSFHFVELLEQDIMAGELMVRSRSLNHPGGCFGYRITDGKNVVAYCTDTEPYQDAATDEKVLELADKADILIYDAQFTPEEYASNRKGWGHSTWQEAIKIAHEADVGTLVLFHHDPYHDDRAIDAIVKEAKVFFPKTIAASRNLEMKLGGSTTDETRTTFSQLGLAPVTAGAGKLPSTSSALDIDFTLRGPDMIIELPRDLSIFNSDKFHERVCGELSAHRPRKVIFDMSRLRFIDSSGIGSIASLNEFCRKSGFDMLLCRVSSQILEVLKVTRIHLIIDVYPTIESAVEGKGKLI